jgi:hypothetical protein
MVAPNPLYMPVDELILPLGGMPNGPFSYSELQSPSFLHSLIVGDLRQQVSLIRGVCNQRKFVNVGIIDYLKPFAYPKPRGPIIICGEIGHVFRGYRFISGISGNKTMDIGWWQQMVCFQLYYHF